MTIGAGWAEGSFVDASFVVDAWEQPSTSHTIGDTSQLEALTSTGGLTVQGQETIGGTSQLEALTSTGQLNLGFQIGGTSQLEAFTSTGGVEAGTTTKGGWLPPKLVKTKIRKKDEEILEQVYEIVAKLEEVPKAVKLVERARKIEVKAKQAIQVKDYTEHNKRIKAMTAQIDRLSTAVTKHIQAARQDEENAIKALLEII